MTDTNLVKTLVDATNSAQGFMYMSPADIATLTAEGLVEQNTEMKDANGNIAARATDKAQQMVSGQASGSAADGAGAVSGKGATSYQIITGAALPEARKRGAHLQGAPTKYPFADLPVGGTFFEPNGNHKSNDAVKALGSTVSAQNRKYATETGEHKTVKRAKRDENNKALLDAEGKKITETVTLPVLKYERKFVIRPVKKGESYGNWTAPEDGALIGRTV